MDGVLYPDLDEGGQRGLLIISRGTAILLLGVYIAYLIVQLKTPLPHFDLRQEPREREALADRSAQEVEEEEEEEEEETPMMSVVAAGLG
jgi:Ca2+:H+ antiporter